jgi:hypothetical protein
VQERGIGVPRERTHRDVAFVSGATNRVIAFVPRPELVGLDVGESAEQLRLEQLESELGAERQRRRSDTALKRAGRERAQAFDRAARTKEGHARVFTTSVMGT